MADVFSKEKRSAVMRRIRSKDTTPELLLRRELHSLGYRYLLHDKRLPGRPDLVFPKYNLVVQVRGCFWHGHTCHDGHLPKTRKSYWHNKRLSNMRRDRKTDRSLRQLGWSVVTVWECKCSSSIKLRREIRRIIRVLNSNLYA